MEVFINILLMAATIIIAVGVCIWFKVKEPDLFLPVLIWETLISLIFVGIFSPWGPWGIIG